MTDLLPLLQQFYGEKLAMMLRHQAGARCVGQYDVNNTYQYIVNREETQLSWLASAIGELGGTLPSAADVERGARDAKAAQRIITEDAKDAQEFADRWEARMTEVRNARHSKMLRLILGEVREHQRFFEQAQAGRLDLLGRRGAQVGPSHGEVLASRWIE